jgi:hypothetical protein
VLLGGSVKNDELRLAFLSRFFDCASPLQQFHVKKTKQKGRIFQTFDSFSVQLFFDNQRQSFSAVP